MKVPVKFKLGAKVILRDSYTHYSIWPRGLGPSLGVITKIDPNTPETYRVGTVWYHEDNLVPDCKFFRRLYGL